MEKLLTAFGSGAMTFLIVMGIVYFIVWSLSISGVDYKSTGLSIALIYGIPLAILAFVYNLI